MDKNKICEALYALSGNVVVKRRKFQLLPAVLFVAGAALIVVNNMYGADLTNNLRSSIVFIGGIMVVAGMIMAAAQMFGSGGAPFHREERCFLLYEELYFDRGIRSDVMQAVSDGDAEHETCAGSGADGGPLPHARQPLRRHAGFRICGSGVQAADGAEDCG